ETSTPPRLESNPAALQTRNVTYQLGRNLMLVSSSEVHRFPHEAQQLRGCFSRIVGHDCESGQAILTLKGSGLRSQEISEIIADFRFWAQDLFYSRKLAIGNWNISVFQNLSQLADNVELLEQDVRQHVQTSRKAEAHYCRCYSDASPIGCW